MQAITSPGVSINHLKARVEIHKRSVFRRALKTDKNKLGNEEGIVSGRAKTKSTTRNLRSRRDFRCSIMLIASRDNQKPVFG